MKHLVEAARRHGADAVAHGCTGKGNDQVRFEILTRALAPDLEVVAPVRTWGFSREDSIDYAQRWGIPVSATKASPYSVDQNLWGRTIESGILEDPWVDAPGRCVRAHRAESGRRRTRGSRRHLPGRNTSGPGRPAVDGR